jgi:hypothetical protein
MSPGFGDAANLDPTAIVKKKSKLITIPNLTPTFVEFSPRNCHYPMT